MAKKGMNPEAVEKMATEITQAGDQAQQIYTQVLGRVTEFDWTGEDRDKYVSAFEGDLGNLVQQIVQQCTEFSERATKNATEQREASA
ncbi:hypothetical protein ACFQS2_05145 [Brachybacterium sp. GCM10030267]|uniref:hypothetical protein n=1 Tax=unclassified Brachybacterium TaxID=2623841 RepID=UPI00362452C1